MLLKYFYDDALAQASYMVGCQKTGEAAVIDPSRDIDSYVKTAEDQGLRITHALETHIHADYISGSRELAAETGAVIYHSAEGAENGGYQFPDSVKTKAVKDGDRITIGNTWVDVMHTPGHTPEHISFLLTDGANPEKPLGLFTGDFVFVGDVGRPDLLEKAAGVKDTADKGARQMFASLKKVRNLDDYLQIWPGHGAGSSCGKALGAVPTTTVGYEKMMNPALQYDEEEAFVDFLLDGQPEPPTYFGEMKRLNTGIIAPLSDVKRAEELSASVEEIEKKAKEDGVVVYDTRPLQQYKQGSVDGTINVPLSPAFLTWLGWIADYEKDIYIIADEDNQQTIASQLRRIGLDRLRGFYPASVVNEASGLRTYVSKAPEDVNLDDVQPLDVRLDDEYEEEHLPHAEHIKMHELEKAEEKLDQEKPAAVYCLTGIRAATAASILLNQGQEVIHLQGGITAWKNNGRDLVQA
ncbi:MBL fold metallo-hydrolase [Alkalicoccus urumqiensis]|uniref:MBL fold metallo-hydrolase n=1 Tax=Alkalicoccus urumqiensis TaxID=1548213 RepID=A0A2P6MIF3_ALKUR|nr:MBL fold metallo-hydrolase [Alkalicoccus urumqiensis]PRO66051.1 MBL fold metallo-hydrolase [Alkalicoccus urumqiensis]